MYEEPKIISETEILDSYEWRESRGGHDFFLTAFPRLTQGGLLIKYHTRRQRPLKEDEGYLSHIMPAVGYIGGTIYFSLHNFRQGMSRQPHVGVQSISVHGDLKAKLNDMLVFAIIENQITEEQIEEMGNYIYKRQTVPFYPLFGENPEWYRSRRNDEEAEDEGQEEGTGEAA